MRGLAWALGSRRGWGSPEPCSGPGGPVWRLSQDRGLDLGLPPADVAVPAHLGRAALGRG